MEDGGAEGTARTQSDLKKEKVKKQTISEMKRLGVYKKEYSRVIEIYSELAAQYEILSTQFEQSGYEFEVDTGQGGSKKAPIVATLETLRKDILAYSDRLYLNPKSSPTSNGNSKGKGKSKLAAAISKLT
ncbi:terminase [Paenibacillus sp. LMG 31461]|uniref:Terminase n=1 Tax=Paenibacillus plantarum TaxID=2654975 RepID=A0ABX1X517_9BACL|nr:P27 family phage terminase small subunit [Paenibacillus plantarum]NOU63169.1 terminase [Paenibacillus plantarum]